MSWYGVSDAYNTVLLTGEIEVEFICPRCMEVTKIKVSANELYNGVEGQCENPKCGCRQSYFSLNLNIDVSYKGTLDSPLED